ncbi:hypothetical protein JIQ42_01681 [Leishmania sp. Namibia]|uniref:hypothetical protein n=1 Tax=Leishmania sp. Namibia TaxID=2802991 RepID=UPI001B440276|nr:hypothetical protein JIQ42_01681 [Leishmania sp. Namibia]
MGQKHKSPPRHPRLLPRHRCLHKKGRHSKSFFLLRRTLSTPFFPLFDKHGSPVWTAFRTYPMRCCFVATLRCKTRPAIGSLPIRDAHPTCTTPICVFAKPMATRSTATTWNTSPDTPRCKPLLREARRKTCWVQSVVSTSSPHTLASSCGCPSSSHSPTAFSFTLCHCHASSWTVIWSCFSPEASLLSCNSPAWTYLEIRSAAPECRPSYDLSSPLLLCCSATYTGPLRLHR